MATKKITLNELRSIVKQIIKEEMILKEAANTDLELKSVAKQIFSILKKYGFDISNFQSQSLNFCMDANSSLFIKYNWFFI